MRRTIGDLSLELSKLDGTVKLELEVDGETNSFRKTGKFTHDGTIKKQESNPPVPTTKFNDQNGTGLDLEFRNPNDGSVLRIQFKQAQNVVPASGVGEKKTVYTFREAQTEANLDHNADVSTRFMAVGNVPTSKQIIRHESGVQTEELVTRDTATQTTVSLFHNDSKSEQASAESAQPKKEMKYVPGVHGGGRYVDKRTNLETPDAIIESNGSAPLKRSDTSAQDFPTKRVKIEDLSIASARYLCMSGYKREPRPSKFWGRVQIDTETHKMFWIEMNGKTHLRLRVEERIDLNYNQLYAEYGPLFPNDEKCFQGCTGSLKVLYPPRSRNKGKRVSKRFTLQRMDDSIMWASNEADSRDGIRFDDPQIVVQAINDSIGRIIDYESDGETNGGSDGEKSTGISDDPYGGFEFESDTSDSEDRVSNYSDRKSEANGYVVTYNRAHATKEGDREHHKGSKGHEKGKEQTTNQEPGEGIEHSNEWIMEDSILADISKKTRKHRHHRKGRAYGPFSGGYSFSRFH